jgi:hypothetical protein
MKKPRKVALAETEKLNFSNGIWSKSSALPPITRIDRLVSVDASGGP